jgi:hypothetical protein
LSRLGRIAATATAIAIVTLLGLAAGPASAAQQGVQAHLLWSGVSDADMRQQLDLVRASGARLVRVDVGWASLQQDGPSGYASWYLDRIDRMVAAADDRGLDLLLTFMNTPCWASTAPASLKQGCRGSWWDRGVDRYAPADPGAYARALAFLARRYGNRVTAWEIWNEPNHDGFFKTGDQAAAYARLLKAAYPAVKAAYPRATVVGGSLSQSDHAFTERLYALGVKGYFDAFSVHPYSDDVSPLDRRPTVDARYSFVRGVPEIRKVMLRHGDRRPVWLTESGWSTATVRGAEPWRNGVSEATQALFMRQQARQVARWPWVKVNVWFNLRDAGSNRADTFSNCGLFRVDGSAKPAWSAFRRAAATLSRATRARAARRAQAARARAARARAARARAARHRR